MVPCCFSMLLGFIHHTNSIFHYYECMKREDRRWISGPLVTSPPSPPSMGPVLSVQRARKNILDVFLPFCFYPVWLIAVSQVDWPSG